MMNVTTGALLVFLLTFQQLHGNAFSKSIGMSVENSSKTNAEKHGNDTHSDKHLEPHKIKVAKFDFDNIATPFVVALWVLLASLLKLGFHMSHRLSKFVPESCVIILLGVLLGGLFDLIDYEEHVTKLPFFTSRIFFLFLLPPIVLEAGYFLHTRAFFDNIGTILLYAVVGTIFNTFTVGLTLFACTDLNISLIQMLLFSCLIAAVDPVAVLAVFEEVHVNEVLYILVFGESLLNDAVTVVLYRLFEALVTQETIKVEEVFVGVAAFFVVSLGGIIIGIFWGFLTAFLTKYTDHVRVLEPIFVFGMSYMSYLNAELFHFSGIISIVTCAIVMKPYVEVNISQKSRIPVKYFMKMASSLSETIIFMLLGVIIFNRRLEFRAGFIFLTILFITIYRSLGVVLLTWLANKIGRLNKLGKVDQFVMAYGGLRGAVAFSLATLIDENHVPAKTIMETTTIVVVFFTVFFQGTTIKPIVDLLKVKRSVKRKEIMLGEVNDKMLDHLLGGIQDVIQHRGHYYWKNLYQYVDVKYLRRWFMRHSRHQAIDETVLSVYRKISHREAMMTEKQRILSGFSESDEYERVVKDRGLFSALAPCKLESGVNEKYKDMYSHVQLAVLLGKPRKGSIHRFSRNNILDETDICDDALRIRRCTRTQAPRHMISKQTSRESADGDGGEKKRRNGHHRPRHNRGHRRHGHRCHVKHRQQKLHKQLSDIVESPITVVPPEIPDQDLHPEDDINEASEEQEDKVSSASESPTESRVLLPKLADIEPSSPTRDNHLMGTDEPAVTVNIPSGSASPGGVDETTM